MTDLEFDVMDELYFVTSFDQLRKTLELEDNELRNVLQGLLRKEWITCYLNHSEEIPPQDIEFNERYKDYYYLATKAGLLAHNGR